MVYPAKDEHPCREQWTPDSKKQYTEYTTTVGDGKGLKKGG